MKTPKHTPGPWKVFRTPSGYDYVEHYPTGKRTDEHICLAEARSPEDAYLISAAPDMLQALELVAPLLKAFDSETWINASKQVETALKKAKGEL